LRTEKTASRRLQAASRKPQAASCTGREPQAASRKPNERCVVKVMIDLSVVPLGVGVSVSAYVAACERVLQEAGLAHTLHAFGTNIEGEWDDVFKAVRRCHEVVHQMGAPRVHSSLRVGTRTDKAQSLDDKVRSVERELEKGRRG
jgi:uncharacterized protein (TIGR00106 family)